MFSFSASSIEFSSSYIQQITQQYGEYAGRRLSAWSKLTTENTQQGEMQKLEAVNLFFNFLEYRSDLSHWGVKDYWATPLEFVVSGAGDCEDFATAKYFTLLDLGVPDKKMLIEYVKYNVSGTVFGQAHMVLLYYETPESVPLVLDNINKEILPGDKRPDLTPIYGFNGSGLWQAKELAKGNKIGDSTDLKRWVSLEKRMKSGQIGKWID